MADAMTIETPLESPALKTLIALIRAEDTFGAWENKSDEDLLEPFIMTPEKRKAIPMMADPDPDVIWRFELFHKALGLSIEKVAGAMATPMLKISHEGFGRLVLIAGDLVVHSKHVRDLHRWGFKDLEKMQEEGDKIIAKAAAMIEKYPELAK
jgi:probable nitrogen fixation protein